LWEDEFPPPAKGTENIFFSFGKKIKMDPYVKVCNSQCTNVPKDPLQRRNLKCTTFNIPQQVNEKVTFASLPDAVCVNFKPKTPGKPVIKSCCFVKEPIKNLE
jgi:hypothetical protein